MRNTVLTVNVSMKRLSVFSVFKGIALHHDEWCRVIFFFRLLDNLLTKNG